MTPERPGHLVVGRFRRPHGLKGECAVFPLTDDPTEVFAPGADLWVLGLDGSVVAGPLRVERSRAYHREWLVSFTGMDAREAVEPWTGKFLGVPPERLRPPAEGEVYLHELEGFAVNDPEGNPLGLVSAVYEFPAGLSIEVQGPRREFLVPYRKEFVTGVDRAARRLVVDFPGEI